MTQVFGTEGANVLAVTDSTAALNLQLAEIKSIYESANLGLCVLDKELRYVRVNQRLADINGIPAKDHIGRTVGEITPFLEGKARDFAQRIFSSGEGITDIELSGTTASQPGVQRSWNAQWLPLKDVSGTVIGINVVVEETTERKRQEEILRTAERQTTKSLENLVTERTSQLFESNQRLEAEIHQRRSSEAALKISTDFLELANRNTDTTSLLNSFVHAIKELTSCHAVGVRLLDSEGNIPYRSYVGFPPEFYELEGSLSVRFDSCMCVNVIKGDVDLSRSFYTPGGSFFQNHTTEFLKTVPESEKGVTRNSCNAFGYETVALVPIRSADGIVGLIHVADEREDMMPLGRVNQIEAIAGHLGNAVDRIKLNEAVKASEIQYRMIFDNANDAVILWELFEDGTNPSVIDVNQETLERYGYTRDEMLKLTSVDLNTPQSLAKAAVYSSILAKNGHGTFEIEHRTKSGESLPSEVSVHTFESAGKKYALSILRDISARKRSEKIIQATLEHEKSLHLKLQEEMDKRVEFTRALIHELKTPLTPIIASSDMMVNQAPEGSLLRLAKQVRTGAYDLEARTNELFDLVKGELGILRLTCSSFTPGILVKEVADSYKPAASNKGIFISFSQKGRLKKTIADEHRVRQVLINLVDNAVKYTPENGSIAILISYFPSYYSVTISDTGPGMTKAQKARLFEPYARLAKDREHYSGLGLGLAISKNIVELHGGSLSVISRIGHGSTFEFSMPYKTPGTGNK